MLKKLWQRHHCLNSRTLAILFSSSNLRRGYKGAGCRCPPPPWSSEIGARGAIIWLNNCQIDTLQNSTAMFIWSGCIRPWKTVKHNGNHGFWTRDPARAFLFSCYQSRQRRYQYQHVLRYCAASSRRLHVWWPPASQRSISSRLLKGSLDKP